MGPIAGPPPTGDRRGGKLASQPMEESVDTNKEAAAAEPTEPWYVLSLERGLAVLRAFDARRPVLRVSEVAQICGLSRAAARRFLLTLESLGYVHGDDGRYSLRPAVLELGFAYFSSMRLDRLLQPELQALSAKTNESCSLAVLSGGEALILARAQTQRLVQTQIGVGSRLPAHATSLGKVLLAALTPGELTARLTGQALQRFTRATKTSIEALQGELAEVRRDGFATAVSELEEGIASVAVPIIGRGEMVIAAINISSNPHRICDQPTATAFLDAIGPAASRIGHALRASSAFQDGFHP